MCFNDDLPSRSGNLAQQATEFGLCSWMEMYFRLLQQKHSRAVMPAELRKERKRLTDAITDIDEVPPRLLSSTSIGPHLNLKGPTTGTAESINPKFIKETGITAKRDQLIPES